MNILLVEDLPMMLKGLRELVDWERNGFSIIGEATNGIEAIEIIEKDKVDIIITDLKMPVMDGLELLEYIRKKKNNIKVVVLSAYNEFDLVRKAFKLGASDYIMKFEIDNTKILNICKKIRLDVQKENNAKVVIKSTDSADLNVNDRLLKDSFFNRLIWGKKITENRIESFKSKLKLNFRDNSLVLMIIVVENYKKVLESKFKNDSRKLSLFLSRIIEEQLDFYNNGDLFSISQSELGIILSYDDSENLNFDNKCVEIFNSIKKALFESMSIRIVGGLSDKKNNINLLSTMYSQASLSSRYWFFVGKGKLAKYVSIPNVSNVNNLKSKDKVEFLRQVLRSMENDKIENSIQRLMAKENEISINSIHDVYDLYERYAWILTEFSLEYSIENECKELVGDFNINIYNKGDLNDLNNWLKKTMLLFVDRTSTMNKIVVLAKSYIKQHYNEEITLNSVSEELFVSSGYLSRIFKQETGEKFLDYLNLYRIEKAKEYIKKGEHKIYEISEEVGYKSTAHFSRVFKKFTGKAPKDYFNLNSF